MEIFNFDAETYQFILTLIGLGFMSIICYLLKKLASKTSTDIDDKIVAKIEEYNNKVKENLKKKK